VPKRMRKRARPARSMGYYRPTPIPGLVLYPTVLLLNLIVRTAEDNDKTDGIIPAETVDVVTALIRNTYDFPDLDLAQGKGVAISFIGQFFHPDDYEEHRIAEMHRRGFLSICFAGERAQLDKLRGDVPTKLWKQMPGVVWQGVDSTGPGRWSN
jgi:hypothetical protein